MGIEFFSNRKNVNQGIRQSDWGSENDYGSYPRQGTRENARLAFGQSSDSKLAGGSEGMNRHPESAAFLDTLTTMLELHDRKQKDYGTLESPFANVRASEDLGVEPWVGGLIRMNDKMRRLHKAAKGGQMANESVEDSLLDLAVYAVITLILYKETNND